jgi:hypothetical protein
MKTMMDRLGFWGRLHRADILFVVTIYLVEITMKYLM